MKKIIKFDSKEFYELQKKYYEKLEKSGFKDLEKFSYKYKRYSKFLSGITDWEKHYNKNINSYDYYIILAAFAENYKFKTKKERKIFYLLSEGYSNKDICLLLNIDKNKFKKIMSKYIIKKNSKAVKKKKRKVINKIDVLDFYYKNIKGDLDD